MLNGYSAGQGLEATLASRKGAGWRKKQVGIDRAILSGQAHLTFVPFSVPQRFRTNHFLDWYG